uniref:Uncharacterized protein n=1 Tax=Photinus pyralis TaxID=7054 RepID=A0A1Y1KQP0_PHOPY
MSMYLHAGQGESVRSDGFELDQQGDSDGHQQLESTQNNLNVISNRQSLLSDANSERYDSDYNASIESNASSHRASIGSHDSEDECEECQHRLQGVLGSPVGGPNNSNPELLIVLRRNEVGIFVNVCAYWVVFLLFSCVSFITLCVRFIVVHSFNMYFRTKT